MNLRVLSFGAGAIGTYLGGSLALHGSQVAFVERPQAAEQIRARGLRLGLETGTRTVSEFSLFTSAAEALSAGGYDFGLVALKSFDLAGLIGELKASSIPPPPLLCVMNGVDNESTLAEAFGPERVIAGTVTSAIGKPGLGEIVVERRRGLGVALGHPLSRQLVRAMDEAGLGARAFPSAGAMKWSKLLTNLVGNATTAILDLPVGRVFADPRLFELEMRMLRECLQVMRALGHAVVDLPGTPVRALALGAHLPASLARPLMQRAVGGGRGGKMPSFHIDLRGLRRGRTEVAWLNGAVVRHGARLGLPTPVNQALTETLEALSLGQLELADFQRRPEALLRLIKD